MTQQTPGDLVPDAGVHGEGTAGSTGVAGSSDTGTGVAGTSESGSGVLGQTVAGRGVEGVAHNGIGVYGSVSGGGLAQIAGHFEGNVEVTLRLRLEPNRLPLANPQATDSDNLLPEDGIVGQLLAVARTTGTGLASPEKVDAARLYFCTAAAVRDPNSGRIIKPAVWELIAGQNTSA